MATIGKQSKKDIEVLCGTLEGQVLANRYRIDKFLDAGNIGQVYRVTDLNKKSSRPLVVKIQKKSKHFY